MVANEFAPLTIKTKKMSFDIFLLSDCGGYWIRTSGYLTISAV